MIEIAADDGHKFFVYRADPAATPKGAVVLVQDVFGINAHIRAIADALAAQGFTAFVPSLFDRIKPGVELGYEEHDIAAGLELANEIGVEQPLQDIQAAVDAAGKLGKVAIIGFGWGGYLAFQAANHVRGLACAVSYYAGGLVDQRHAKRKVPALLHFGEADASIPFQDVEQFRAHHPDVSAFTYPGGQGFDCAARPGYEAEATQKAFERSLSWISQFVVGQAPILLKNAGAYAAAKTEKKPKEGKAKSAAGADDLGPPA